MKRVLLFIILIIGCLTISSCVKTTDLEKRKAEEQAQIEAEKNTQLDETSDVLSEEVIDESDIKVEQPLVETDEETANLTLNIDELTQQVKDSEKKVSELEAQLVLEAESSSLLSGPTLGNPLLLEASNVMLALSTNDMATLSLYVPTLSGLRLSPYPFVDLATDVVLTQSDVANLMTLPTTYLWGSYDGSGDPINLTAANYYTEFIYDYNYLIAPQIGQNVILSGGNMLNNIATSYPTASYVEFYFPGFDPQYGGLDWSSLTLVFENQGGYWMLVGIVHGQWTI